MECDALGFPTTAVQHLTTSKICPNNRGHLCHELRINDADKTWRVIYRIDPDAIVIAEVFAKKTEKTPKDVIQACKKRLMEYDNA